MKRQRKSFFTLLLLLSLGVTSCTGFSSPSSGGGSGGSSSGQTDTGDKVETGEDVLNKDIINANLMGEGTIDSDSGPVFKQNKHNDIKNENIVNGSYANLGLLVIKNSQDKIGFYSMLHHDYILSPQFDEDKVTYDVLSSQYSGFILNVTSEDVTKCYDGFANRLYDEFRVNSIDFETIVDGTPYMMVSYGEEIYSNLGSQIFSYSDAGVASTIEAIPSPSVVNYPDNDDSGYTYTGPIAGELVTVGWLDLSSFGQVDYAICFADNYITTYYKEQFVTSFYLDLNVYHIAGLVNDSLLAQRTIEVSEDASSFDYSIGKTKYVLETFLINFKTAGKTTVNYKMLFDSFYILNAEAEAEQYFLLRYKEVNTKTKTLGEEKEVIIDKDFIFHDDVTGMGLLNFYRYPDVSEESYVYYNYSTGVLYDSTLTPITNLKYLNPTYSPTINMFKCNYQGKYGIVDLDGHVVIEFKYDEIIDNTAREERCLAKIGNQVYRLDLNYRDDEYLGTGLYEVSYDLYRTSEQLYFTTAHSLFRAPDGEDTMIVPINYLGKQLVYFVFTNLAQESFTLTSFKYDNFEINKIDELNKTFIQVPTYMVESGELNILLDEKGKFDVRFKADANTYYTLYFENDDTEATLALESITGQKVVESVYAEGETFKDSEHVFYKSVSVFCGEEGEYFARFIYQKSDIEEFTVYLEQTIFEIYNSEKNYEIDFAEGKKDFIFMNISPNSQSVKFELSFDPTKISGTLAVYTMNGSVTKESDLVSYVNLSVAGAAVIQLRGKVLVDEEDLAPAIMKTTFESPSGGGGGGHSAPPVVDPYSVLLSNPADEYGWKEISEGYYCSNNAGVDDSIARMYIYFNINCLFSFNFLSSGELGCDYLVARLNGASENLFDCSADDMDDYVLYENTFNAGDILILEFIKDGGGADKEDCAYIEIVGLTAI